MTTSDDARREQHRRPSGQFGEQERTAPEAVLAAPLPRLMGYPYPDGYASVFQDAATFQQVDEIWKREATGGFSRELGIRWSAIERCAKIREAGVVAVPTSQESQFSAAQCDVELADLWELATEEVHGDGEWSRAQSNSYVGRLYQEYLARRRELAAAGVVTGPAPVR